MSLTVFELQSGHEITTVTFQRGITQKMYGQELQFLFSALRLMMLYISMTFHENILNGFRVLKRTQNNPLSNFKGEKLKNYNVYRQELEFLCSAHCLMMLYISIKSHENILKGFQVMERTRIYHCRISKCNNSKTV